MAVHTELGPGLLESIYRECLGIELCSVDLHAESEKRVRLRYKEQQLTTDLKVDLVVENLVVVEVKAVDRLHPVHLAQVITYLKLTGCPAGLLINFNATSIRFGLRRLDHPDVYKGRVNSRKKTS